MRGATGVLTRSLVDRARSGGDLDLDGVSALLRARGTELEAVVRAADALRREQVGDTVSYVVNRNINFTNVCVKRCSFCAFARGYRAEEGYRLSLEQVVARAVEAAELGATEVCIQAGLAPELTAEHYVALCAAVHEAVPQVHIHAFSPEEVRYAAQRSRWTVREVLRALQEAGLGSIPGTSAEILVDEVRDRLAPGRLRTADWVEVVRTAHELGIPSTSTVMYGHLETPEHVAEHLLLLRTLQRDTGGLTELVPLAFVWQEAPLWRLGLEPDVRQGPTVDETRALMATCRLVLGRDIPHLQASWVKVGLDRATELLDAGADDLGGTLINESISTSAGAGHGQFQSPRALREAIRSRGRRPMQRATTYAPLRVFGEVEDVEESELDAVSDPNARFGSYAALTQAARDARAAR